MKPTIGFIGTGVMGKSMAHRLLEAGYDVHTYTRTASKAKELLQNGAIWQGSVKELAKQTDVIITMVGYPRDVEEVYFGTNGLIENALKGSILIDMTTSSPDLAKKIAEKAKEKELHAIDAPVSGGDIGARNGKLSIMVGGENHTVDQVMPIFKELGQNYVWQGPAGAGQFTKMCNQIAIASTMIGVTEALVYAEKAGLDPNIVLESISGGAAGSWSLSHLTPRVIRRDFSPGFFIKHFIKDMTIAIESAEEMGIDLPGLKLAKELYEELARNGEENSGTQALYKYYV
ncbi:putative oxidoreductase YkwC [Halobacillus andaensis]|uniref:Oxidoreductase YkwC n=1 Tax=Halobacillus andaensis TaxID=1176239 RepID=A0A917B7Y8_HALAA|nr:NAD(P)-dependent oxidoreductase [Halobacillus andaensis]MBP2005340.1 3-hydroxyisobutyrate dehydrogenase [Halobacillus andaensis]GGF30721.1 putative oxidoreductase YkwC [Halobacillus andaensis]